VIFADPPYDKTKSGEQFTQLLLDSVELIRMLEPAGVFVLEKRPEEQVPAAPLWKISRDRRYGATEVLFLQPVGSLADAPASR
jgi:16S rRNA G966 N2-methylase RsmD